MTLPHTNILSNKDDWTIEVAAPGLDKKDFKIAIDKDVLTVSYNVKKESNNSFVRNSFQRSWNLPEGTKFEDIKASYKSGTLGLTVKKPDIIKQETKYIDIT